MGRRFCLESGVLGEKNLRGSAPRPVGEKGCFNIYWLAMNEHDRAGGGRRTVAGAPSSKLLRLLDARLARPIATTGRHHHSAQLRDGWGSCFGLTDTALV